MPLRKNPLRLSREIYTYLSTGSGAWYKKEDYEAVPTRTLACALLSEAKTLAAANTKKLLKARPRLTISHVRIQAQDQLQLVILTEALRHVGTARYSGHNGLLSFVKLHKPVPLGNTAESPLLYYLEVTAAKEPIPLRYSITRIVATLPKFKAEPIIETLPTGSGTLRIQSRHARTIYREMA